LKKIVVIQGSPRKNGNTRAVTALAMAAAREQGAEVSEIDATGLKFKVPGCLGCQKCQSSDEFVCSIGDALGQTVATLPAYDVIVLSTPLYWWSYAAQLKIFIDRMYSLGKFDASGGYRMALAGKKLGLIATAGGPIDNNLELLERQWKNPADMMGCSFSSCLFANVTAAPGKLVDDREVAKKARAFGEMLAA
jgi:multimeric flavodoxin WrbA